MVKKPCRFCLEQATTIGFTDLERIGRCVTDRGKIIPSRLSGTCAKHQRVLCQAIKRARFMALLPYVTM
jgi:small subunit ribosomal protein S18